MSDPDFHTDSIHCFLKDAVSNLEEIEDRHGQMREFSYETHDAYDGTIENAYLITDDASVFRITVTRIA